MAKAKHSRKAILNRLSYIHGHLEAVRKMTEDDRYCIDIIHQNEAIIEALKKVNNLLLADHLETCVVTAIKSSNIQERKKKIKELLKIYQQQHNKL